MALASAALLNVVSLLIWNLNYKQVPLLAGAPNLPYVQDFVGLALLLVVAGCGLAAGLPSMADGLRKAAQWSAACLVVFALRILVLDPSEFYLHTTDLQAASGVLPWFSNADLLVVSSALLVVATAFGRGRAAAQR